MNDFDFGDFLRSVGLLTLIGGGLFVAWLLGYAWRGLG